MFKAYFLIQPGDDPFALRGSDAAAAARERFPRLRGYYQTRALPGQDDIAFSAAAECWFTDAEAAVEACEEGLGGLLAPGAEVHSTLAGMERVVMQQPGYLTAARVKGVYPFRRRPDLSLADFQDYWWHTHGPIAALTEEALSYHQVHPVPLAYERLAPAYDGITEITWPDAGAAGRALVSRQMREDQGSDAPNFVDLDSIALFLAEEEIVIAP